MVLRWAGGSGPWPVIAGRVFAVGAGSGGGVVQGDVVAEGFELGDQAAGFPFGVQAAGEVAGAGFLAGFPGGQDVPVR
jgi:hypothetical protein